MQESLLIDAYAALCRSMPGYLALCPSAPSQPFQATATGEPLRKRRKRSGEPALKQADIEGRQHHASIRHWLEKAIKAAREEHLARPSCAAWSSAPLVPRFRADTEIEDIVPMDEVAKAEPLHQVYDLAKAQIVTPRQLLRGPHLNSSDALIEMGLPDRTLLIPPRSAFLLADLDHWQEPLKSMARLVSGIDLVLLDPPWPNKSASRSSSYATFDIYDLFALDLPSILDKADSSKPTLIAIWLTNKPKFRRFVLDKLFPAWRIERAATNWYWVKVTGGALDEGGQPVWPLESEHRRCYEPVILGWYRAPAASTAPLPALPDRHVFLSVPLGHSRKPPLLDLVRPFLSTEHPTVLELFARMASSGGKAPGLYLAAGNQVLAFNDARHWIAETSCKPVATGAEADGIAEA